MKETSTGCGDPSASMAIPIDGVPGEAEHARWGYLDPTDAAS